MDRWTNTPSKSTNVFGPLGRLGDTIDFNLLSTKVQNVEVAKYLGAVEENTDGFEACGSPGEVANKPELGNRYRMEMGNGDNGWSGLYQSYYSSSGKNMVWTNVVLKAPDQLR